eukprot:5894701-Alexandrium_andersonii.AAC.1
MSSVALLLLECSGRSVGLGIGRCAVRATIQEASEGLYQRAPTTAGAAHCRKPPQTAAHCRKPPQAAARKKS